MQNPTANCHSKEFDLMIQPSNCRYVIKATTYEIGILADVPDNDTTTDDGPVTRQQVDLSFYNAESNDSFVNFGDVPLPIQTNVSGQIITGVAPVHIGAVQNIGDVLQSLPFSGTIVNITQGDTSFIHVSRENITDDEGQVTLDDSEDLAKLPILNNVLLPDSFDEAFNSVTQPTEEAPSNDKRSTEPKPCNAKKA